MLVGLWGSGARGSGALGLGPTTTNHESAVRCAPLAHRAWPRCAPTAPLYCPQANSTAYVGNLSTALRLRVRLGSRIHKSLVWFLDDPPQIPRMVLYKLMESCGDFLLLFLGAFRTQNNPLHIEHGPTESTCSLLHGIRALVPSPAAIAEGSGSQAPLPFRNSERAFRNRRRCDRNAVQP